MGYQITFVPTEEKMKEYKPWNEDRSKDSMVDAFKYELISFCMKHHEDSVSNIVKQLGFYLRCLASAVETEEKVNAYFRWKEDENHELWYCGWEFSHEARHGKDEIMQDTIEKLLIFADLVETPSYFDQHDNFYTKLHDVKEDVEGFIELMQEIAIHDIINDMEEFKVKDEEEEQ